MSNVRPPAPHPHSLGSGIETLRAKWGWVVALGVVFLVAGFVAFGSVMTATVASVLVVGFMMMAGGVGEIVHAFAVKTWGRFFLWLALGLLYLLGGISVIMNPLLAASFLTLMLGGALLASGIIRIVLAFQMKEGSSWLMVALSGAISILIGVMILLRWPASSLFVLGTFLGIDLIFIGTSWIMMGLALRNRRAYISPVQRGFSRTP